MKLSFFLPGIRIENWVGLYNSIQQSYSGEFELIIVGPYTPSDEFLALFNTKYFKDYGSPTRCMQIALLLTSGEYLFLGATDDSTFLSHTVDRSINLIESGDEDIILAKYTESDNPSPTMFLEEYYRTYGHESLKRLSCVDHTWYAAGAGIVRREYILGLGGYDCQFEGTTFSCLDLCFRIQTVGGKCMLTNEIVFHCDHGQPGHEPIESAFFQNDQPVFHRIYGDKQLSQRKSIDINNWKQSDAVWRRRNFN